MKFLIMEEYVMSELERYIILSIALVLLSTTGSRFILQELIALVKLCKELRAEVQKPLPPSPRHEALLDSDSKSVSGVSVRSSAE